MWTNPDLTVGQERGPAANRVLSETVELTGAKRALSITEIQSCGTASSTAVKIEKNTVELENKMYMFNMCVYQWKR